MFMVLSSWHSNCESSPGSFDECRLSAGWPPTLRPNQLIWAVSLPIGCYHPQTPSPFITITQLVSWYSFYRPTEGGRLSRPRHCSKGAQPVPKAVYCSDWTVVINTTGRGEIRTGSSRKPFVAILPNLQLTCSRVQKWTLIMFWVQKVKVMTRSNIICQNSTLGILKVTCLIIMITDNVSSEFMLINIWPLSTS